MIGAGIAVMHYSGMEAMSISGDIRWDADLVVASIAAGIVLSAIAMWSFAAKGSLPLAAGALTAAICVLHFTAMGAATVEYDPTFVASSAQIDNKLLATALAAVTLLVILSGLTAALINHDTTRELQHLADHDHLTGLPNRGYINRLIDTSINSGAEAGFALLFVDLDRFKCINDGHGHLIGDHVLQKAAQRLRRAANGTAVVGRVGGDEFIVMQAGSEPARARRLAKAIMASFEPPFDLPGGRDTALGVSIGVALFPRDGQDRESLLRAADDALYWVKQRGGGAATLAA